jgi:dipeptidyl-peptidase-4
MRFLLCFLAALSAVPASAERLTLDRIHADPALAGPGVRNLKVSPDGERVTFLRGRPDNQFQLDLWELSSRVTASSSLSTELAYENLTYPSPCLPKPAPEREATPASFSALLSNCSLDKPVPAMLANA